MFDDKVQKTLSLKDRVIKLLHVILVKWFSTMQRMQSLFYKLHEFVFYFIIYHTVFSFPLQFNGFIITE